MIRLRNEKKGQPPFNFPTANWKNVACVRCNHRFFLQDLNLRGSQIPLLLHCGHPICNACANSLISSVCPQCLSSQEGTIKEILFPLHLYVLGLTVSEAMQTTKEHEVDFSFSHPKDLKSSELQGDDVSVKDLCSECGTEAAIKCLQCIVSFCEECYMKIHGKTLHDYKSIKLYNITDDIPVNVIFCKDNCKQQIRYYCNDCESSYCAECILISHMKHDIINLGEKNKHYMDKFTNLYIAAQETLQRIHEIEGQLSSDKLCSPLTAKVKQVETSISQHFTRLHGILQNLEKKFMDELHKPYALMEYTVDQTKSKLRHLEDELKSVIRLASYAKEHLKGIDMTVVVEKLEKTAEVALEMHQDYSNMKEEISFEFDESIVEALEKHCTLRMPPTPQFVLIKSDTKNSQRNDTASETSQIDGTALSNASLDYSDESEFFNPLESSSRQDLTKNTTAILRDKATTYVPVVVTNVVDPSHFYIQYCSDKERLEELSESLEQYCSKEDVPYAQNIKVSKIYAVYRSCEKKWQRARIMAINQNVDSSFTYDVHYVDYGYEEKYVPCSNVKTMPQRDAAVSIFSVRCSLCNIATSGIRWDKTAIETFRKLINLHSQIFMQINCIIGKTHYVDLYFHQNDMQDLSSARDVLVLMEQGNLISLQKLMRSNFSSTPTIFKEELDMQNFTEVKVRLVESPDSLYVTKTGKHEEYVEKMMRSMSQHYRSDSSTLQPEIGLFCVVLSDDDGRWYRGVILNILESGKVSVFCVDFGHTLTTEIEKIRRLAPTFMTCRTQAINVSLRYVKPLATDKKQWNNRIINLVKQHLTDEIVKLIPFEKEVDHYKVFLYLYDKVNFSSFLVRNNLAEYTGPTNSREYEIVTNTEQHDESLEDLVKKRLNKKTRRKKAKHSNVSKNNEGNNKTLTSTSTSLTNSSEKLSLISSTPSNKLEPSIPQKDPFMTNVIVYNAESPYCIYVADVAHKDSYKKINSLIQDFYTKYYTKPQSKWEKNALCIAYSQKDQSYYRARIIDIMSNERVLVFLYDIALEEVVPMKHIQPLYHKFALAPTYLFKVSLAGISPCGDSSSWPTYSCEKLKELINDSNNCAFSITKLDKTYIKLLQEDGENDTAAVPVELWIKRRGTQGPLSPTQLETICVNRKLVEEGVALPVRGFYEKSSKILAIEFKKQLKRYLNDNKFNDVDVKWFSVHNELHESIDEGILDNLMSALMLNSSDSEEVESEEDENSSLRLNHWLPPAPILKKTFMAIPTYLDHDAMLYLHPAKFTTNLKQIESGLTEFYEKVQIESFCDKKWKEGDVCIAQYHGNNKWYRAQVLKVMDENKVEVQFVDYGNIEECTIGTLTKQVKLLHIPIQASKCIIHGLIPNTDDGKWKLEDLDKIHALLVDKICKVTILEKTRTHLIVSVKLIKPRKCDLITYLIEDLGLNIRSDVGNISDQENNFAEVIADIITSDSSFLTKNVVKSNFNRNKKIQTDKKPSLNAINMENHGHFSASTSQEISEEDLAQYTPLVIPDHIEKLIVELSCVIDGTTFIMQLKQNENIQILNDYYNQYRKAWNDMQENAMKQPIVKNLAKNVPCCAKFTDNNWYRALILELKDTSKRKEVLVHLIYVDFGNEEWQTVNLERVNLYSLKEEWLCIPTLAINCHLSDVTLTSDIDISTLTSRIDEEIGGKLLVAKIKNRQDKYMDVELYTDEDCREKAYVSFISNRFYRMKKSKED